MEGDRSPRGVEQVERSVFYVFVGYLGRSGDSRAMEFFESLSFISRGSFNISEAFNDRINKKAQVAIIYLIYSIYR